MWRGWCDESRDCPQETAYGGVGAPAAGARGDSEVLPFVGGLDAGLVPLREFPLRKWYYAAYYDNPEYTNPRWYYHLPALQHRLSDNPKFYELVDPPLRELVRLVRAAGLYTTPSCSGHFYGRERFARIWADLLDDAEQIRGPGLVVKDSESNSEHIFRDPAYALPWPHFAAFYAAADANQQKGYIGIAIPPGRPALAQAFQRAPFESRYGEARIVLDEDLTRLFGHPVFGVYVSAAAARDRDRAWNELTNHVRGLLR